jgi:hypothetical protein
MAATSNSDDSLDGFLKQSPSGSYDKPVGRIPDDHLNHCVVDHSNGSFKGAVSNPHGSALGSPP